MGTQNEYSRYIYRYIGPGTTFQRSKQVHGANTRVALEYNLNVTMLQMISHDANEWCECFSTFSPNATFSFHLGDVWTMSQNPCCRCFEMKRAQTRNDTQNHTHCQSKLSPNLLNSICMLNFLAFFCGQSACVSFFPAVVGGWKYMLFNQPAIPNIRGKNRCQSNHLGIH